MPARPHSDFVVRSTSLVEAEAPRVYAPPVTSGAHGRQVVIDALAARYGGAAYAAVQVAHHLADDPVLGDVVLVTRAGSLVSRGVREREGLRVVELPPDGRFELGRRLAWEALGLPRLTGGSSPAVLTWSGMLPRAFGAPVFCYLANPIVFEDRGLAQSVRRWAAGRTARRAADVLVPTRAMGELSAGTIGRGFSVVRLGIDHDRFRPAPVLGDEELCVGDLYVHKRHDVVLSAWSRLPEPRPTLRLVGNPAVDAGHAAHVLAEVERHRRLGPIVVQSGLSLGELVETYQRARVLISASQRESFSMPLLEAQACGVPAVVRDLPALRETGGNGTRYVSGDDPGEWEAALGEILLDDAAAAAARERGIENALRYSWQRTASALRDRIIAA